MVGVPPDKLTLVAMTGDISEASAPEKVKMKGPPAPPVRAVRADRGEQLKCRVHRCCGQCSAICNGCRSLSLNPKRERAAGGASTNRHGLQIIDNQALRLHAQELRRAGLHA